MISFRVRLSFFSRAAAARLCGHDPFAQAHVDCPGNHFPGLRTEFFPDNTRFNRLHVTEVLSTTCRQLTIVETRQMLTKVNTKKRSGMRPLGIDLFAGAGD